MHVVSSSAVALAYSSASQNGNAQRSDPSRYHLLILSHTINGERYTEPCTSGSVRTRGRPITIVLRTIACLHRMSDLVAQQGHTACKMQKKRIRQNTTCLLQPQITCTSFTNALVIRFLLQRADSCAASVCRGVGLIRRTTRRSDVAFLVVRTASQAARSDYAVPRFGVRSRDRCGAMPVLRVAP